MTTSTGLEHCHSFIHSQLHLAREGPGAPPKLAVTLSRQAGSGAWLVAAKLADYLQLHAPPAACRWTVFDKELVEKVLEDHNLPKKLAAYMPEDRVSAIEDALQEILGLHPPSSTLLDQTAETILKLGELGSVILIGRGAMIITAKLPHVFHVRLIGSLEKRLERVMERFHFDRKAALEQVVKCDRGRQRYLKEHFKAEADDPMLYDLIINTDRIACEDAAVLIGEAMLRRAARQKPTSAPGRPNGTKQA